jgi:transcriptional regulator with XRE-family HTH domain
MQVPASSDFRKNLNTAMVAREMSIQQVADAAGMVRPYVSRVLNGHTKPLLDQADRLAKAVRYPLPTLLGNPKDFSDTVLTAVTN